MDYKNAMGKKLISFGLTTLILSGCTLSAPKESDTFLNTVDETYELAEQWFRSNVRDKGLFNYIYDVDNDEYPDKNNAIRQLMASRLLAELSQEDDSLIPMHRKNIEFIFNNWYREEEDNGFIFYNDKSKLGANAMALRALSASPFFGEYEEEAKKLSRSILSLMNDDGSFHPWFKEPSYEYDADYLLTFYSGEAIVALLEYFERAGISESLEAAKRAQEFYIDRYVVHLAENYYPAYVPWHTISLSKLYNITGDQKYADAIFVLNDKLLEILDTDEYVGRFYNPLTPQYGTPHSSSDGVYTEGLAYAYEVAQLIGDQEHVVSYKEALEIAVDNLSSLQYSNEEGSKYKDPSKVIGAIRYKAGDDRIRIDTVQHAMDAFLKIKVIQN